MEPFEFQPHCSWSNAECCRACSHGAEFAELTTQPLAWIPQLLRCNNNARKIAPRFTCEHALEYARNCSAQLAAEYAFEFNDACECCKIFFNEAQEALTESIVVGVE